MPITDPTDISGCVLWLDPSTISASDGDLVSAWADQSGNANDASSSGVDRPTYRDGTAFYHGSPALEWTDVGVRMAVATSATLAHTNVTYAIVCRLSDLGPNTDPQWLINKRNTNPGTVGLRVADSDITNKGLYESFFRLAASPGTVRTVGSTGPYYGSWVVLLFRYNGTTGELYVNEDLSKSLSVSGSIDTASNNDITIGNHPTVDDGWLGWIGDIVVYDNSISDTDRDDLIAYLRTKYANSEWEDKQGVNTTIPSATRHARIRSASETGLSEHQMLVVDESTGDVDHYTSPLGDPHNWTLQNSSIISGSFFRTLGFTVVSGTWYVYVDDAQSNGRIKLYTGSGPTTLSEHGSSPVITGSAGNYVRTPDIWHESGSWTMLLDIRTDSLTGGVGRVDRYTSSDGITWTKDTVNSPVISPVGTSFEETDITHPSIFKRGDNDYLIAYAGFSTQHPLNSTFFPHEIAILESTDLISFTRSDSLPALSGNQGSSSFSCKQISNPCIFNDGTNLTLYYAGLNLSNVTRYGYAIGPAPPSTSYAVSNTMALIQTMNSGAYFVLAADRLFFFGAFGEEGQEVTHNFFSYDASNTFNLTSETGYNQELDIIQYLGFSGERFIETISNFIGFEDFINRAYLESASNAFSFIDHDGTDDPTAVIRAYTALNEIAFVEIVTFGQEEDVRNDLGLTDEADSADTEYVRPATHSVIKQSLAFSISGPKCIEQQYNPLIGIEDDEYDNMPTTAPTLVKDTLTLYYPSSSPTTTLVLKNPAFNNQDLMQFSVIDRETRGGGRIIFGDPKWATVETRQMKLERVCSPEMDDLISFLNLSLGKEIKLKDWEGRNWAGVILTPNTQIVKSVGGYSITLLFRGSLV